MSSSYRLLSRVPPLFVLVPILLMLVASVQCQAEVPTTSLLGALIINKIERCIDKLNAIVDVVGLLAGGV